MKIDFKDMKGLNVPAYCRKLKRKVEFPSTLEIYRDEMLCLTVDVDGAAGLKLVENNKQGPRYEKFTDKDVLKYQRLRGLVG